MPAVTSGITAKYSRRRSANSKEEGRFGSSVKTTLSLLLFTPTSERLPPTAISIAFTPDKERTYFSTFSVTSSV
ncbi:hypothetical protein SDC9_111240 [bioreactor metagenome]|uniref:Uncharacterized protein n=1 Tax=bioreactor metagenome TaxID=1076179 RepID=A0A645BRA3_9ZZZZ